MCHSIISVVYPKLTEKEDYSFKKNCREKILDLIGKDVLAIQFYHEDSPFKSRKIFGGKEVKIVILMDNIKRHEEIRLKISQNHEIGEFHTWDSFKESVKKNS